MKNTIPATFDIMYYIIIPSRISGHVIGMKIPVLPLTSSVNLHILFDPSAIQFSNLKNRGNNNIYFKELEIYSAPQ